ncbi:PEP-CTERM system associated protein [Nitrosococcus watsonii]|uniref:PEP-CTERM system associated protein n=1 Tax=Nitrosococcus watsoni (strain C-113) TaxID=105559 RepID=D8K6W6_NITWC|nr:PEP-CTERM system associated protein [Nitrosococcus watsonii]ADJ28643.1 PEP-CTERM system associated protein [Nitrosococcus watsonii C-113]
MCAGRRFGLIGGGVLLFFGACANGSEWKFTPLLAGGEIYTDNVTLAPRGEEESDFITQITPGFFLRGTGSRLRLGANYFMQNLLFAKDSDRNTTFHRFLGSARAELAEDHLFFDLRASVFQALVSPTGATPPFRGFGGGGMGGGFGGGGMGGGFGGGGMGGGFGGGGMGGGFGGGGMGGGFGGGGMGGGFGGGRSGVCSSGGGGMGGGFGGGGMGGGFGGGGMGGGFGGGGMGGGFGGGGMGGGFGGGGMGGGFGGGGFGGGGAGNLFATGNISTVVTLQASPFYCWRWGNTASGQVRYQRQEVLVAPEGTPTTNADRIFGILRSGSRFDRFRWAFLTNQRYTHREDSPTVQLANYLFRLQMRLFRRVSAFGILGYEDNAFRRSAGDGSTSGTRWSVGLSYNPSRRTRIVGGVGQRFFGTTAFVRAIYRTKRNIFSASYGQQFFTYDQLLFQQPDFTEGPINTLPTVTTETFLSTNTMLSWTYLMTEKTRLLVRGFQVNREFQESGEEEDLKGGNLFWIWNFSSRTNILAGGMWMQRSFPSTPPDPSRSDNLWNASLGIRHRFSPKSGLSLRYTHGQRDSTDSESDFGMNMVFATVFMRF